jgi:hypothetical protein
MTIRSLTSWVSALALLASCDPKTETPATKPTTKAQKQAQIEKVRLLFDGPTVPNGSGYVLYPLRLNTHVEEGEDSYGSKSRYETNTYWNIVFYNPADGTSHLLDAPRKMVIYAYGLREPSSPQAAVAPAAEAGPADKLLYYTVRLDDFNQDGEIDDKDPGYLFVSDQAGRGFRQVSPAAYHVESWQVMEGTSKILLQATADTNNNNAFDPQDLTVPMVYDVQGGGVAKEVFSPAFKGQLKQRLHSQWPPKPQ